MVRKTVCLFLLSLFASVAFSNHNVLLGAAYLVPPGDSSVSSHSVVSDDTARAKSVATSLKWIARHQLPDGSWNFNHQKGPGEDRDSPNPGRGTSARFAATALCLLAFMEAGHTPERGEHKAAVAAGLRFLASNGRKTKHGSSFHEPQGSMYSHALATLCLCQAYRMTKDETFRAPAAGGIQFIQYAQDPVEGGWRYQPKQPGDTSVTGWQLQALAQARFAEIETSDASIQRAAGFLDRVGQKDGAFYGYTEPGRRKGTTASGLLCRMLLGWDRETAALARGVKWINSHGPSRAKPGGADEKPPHIDMYFNYYGTLTMRRYGGDMEKNWTANLQTFLLETQETDGTAEGSWWFRGGIAADIGGRLYCTAMSSLVLTHLAKEPEALSLEVAPGDDLP